MFNPQKSQEDRFTVNSNTSSDDILSNIKKRLGVSYESEATNSGSTQQSNEYINQETESLAQQNQNHASNSPLSYNNLDDDFDFDLEFDKVVSSNSEARNAYRAYNNFDSRSQPEANPETELEIDDAFDVENINEDAHTNEVDIEEWNGGISTTQTDLQNAEFLNDKTTSASSNEEEPYSIPTENNYEHSANTQYESSYTKNTNQEVAQENAAPYEGSRAQESTETESVQTQQEPTEEHDIFDMLAQQMRNMCNIIAREEVRDWCENNLRPMAEQFAREEFKKQGNSGY